MASKNYNINSNLYVNDGQIVGGYNNILTGSTKSSIVGGKGNYINDGYTTEIVGGYQNQITNTGWISSIVGGYNNLIDNGWGNFVGNGGENEINNSVYSSIGGGYLNNIVNGEYSSIGGGKGNTLTGLTRYSSILSGEGNVIDDINGNGWNIIGGGFQNKIESNTPSKWVNTIAGGGYNDIIESEYSFIGGGASNRLSGATKSSIVGGYTNRIETPSGSADFIGGGGKNQITGNTYANAIVVGYGNKIHDTVDSFIGGGLNNTISNGYFSTIGGGSENTVNNGSYNSIVGGYGNQTNNAYYSNILDGFNNQINNAGFLSSILGGYANKIDRHSTGATYFNNWNSIQGGAFNKIYVSNGQSVPPNIEGGNVIGGGSSNYIYGDDRNKKANKNTILNGFSNKITGATSGFIGNGYKNEILSYNYSSIIANGIENKITDGYQLPGSPLLPQLPVFDPRRKPPGTLGNTIGGGGLNTIVGTVRDFGGGNNNTYGYLTDGKFNTIGGGYRNYISGRYNTIAGGGRVQADFFFSISEGGNIISGNSSTIGGGLGHKIYGRYSTIGGGGFYSNVKPTVYGNTIIGNMSVIAGGFSNVIDTSPWYSYGGANPGNSVSSILGGNGNKINNGRFSWSTIGGGHYNYVRAGSAFIGGGSTNIIGYGLNPIEYFPDGGYSSIIGGYNNKIYSDYGFIGNGYGNSIFTGSTFSFIGNGYNNDIHKSTYSSILVGKSNYIGYSSYSGILGGKDNIITGVTYTSILGGQNNLVRHTNSHIIGSNITSVSANTTHVERLNIKTIDNNNSLPNVLVRDTDGTVRYRTAQSIANSFTGNTSGSCITDLYVTNLYGCSPLHIDPSGVNDVYIVENGGNVGIGTSTPSEKLHVSGNTIISGTLNIGTVTTGSTATEVLVRETNGIVNTVNLSTFTQQKYAASIPFTAATSQTVTHNLNDTDVIVQLKDSTGTLVIPNVVDNYTNNTVDIQVSSTETFRVIIIG